MRRVVLDITFTRIHECGNINIAVILKSRHHLLQLLEAVAAVVIGNQAHVGSGILDAVVAIAAQSAPERWHTLTSLRINS